MADIWDSGRIGHFREVCYKNRYLWRKKERGKKRVRGKGEEGKEEEKRKEMEIDGFCSESTSDHRYSRVRGRIPIMLLLGICMYVFV